VELTTAWHLKVFRKEVRLETVLEALADLEHDIEAGIWAPPAYDLADVHDRAERLARRHAAVVGARSLDILHVAAAQALGLADFVTGDRRQAELARAAGLTTIVTAPRS
jgi:predicted nucleic acid-binding protein